MSILSFGGSGKFGVRTIHKFVRISTHTFCFTYSLPIDDSGSVDYLCLYVMCGFYVDVRM